jgi:elongation factor Ts
MEIQASEVKKLRELTGAGMMDAKQALAEAGGNIETALELLRKKGQKIAAKRSGRDVKEGYIGVYLHANGKIAAMVELLCETDFVARNQDFRKFANELAMQVAAMSPQYVTPEEVPSAIIDKEREIYQAEMDGTDKPANVLEKIITGKLDKFFSQICLLKQTYIKDDTYTIEKLLTEQIAKIGENIKIGQIARFSL